MNYFIYSKAPHHNKNIEIIDEFSCIREFGHEKYLNIRPTSLEMHHNKGIEICFITKGKYDWKVEEKEYSLLPGNGFITCPWEYHGSERGIVDLGEIWWIVICPDLFDKTGKFKLGKWSGLTESEEKEIGEVLSKNSYPLIHKAEELEIIFRQLSRELKNKDFGYKTSIHKLIECLLIHTVRLIKNRDDQQEEIISWLKSLEAHLSHNISKKYKVGEMAAFFNMGTTSFNEKVKRLTGYTPSAYLIQLRIAKAKHLLQNSDQTITEIAFDSGFYSSQHFSGTFLKMTGMTPSNYRKSK